MEMNLKTEIMSPIKKSKPEEHISVHQCPSVVETPNANQTRHPTSRCGWTLEVAMISKLTSLFMAIFIIGTIFITDGAKDAMQLGIGMVFILALIWFGDAMGDYTGPTGHGAITASTPGCMLRGFGWLVIFVAFLASIFQLVGYIKE